MKTFFRELYQSFQNIHGYPVVFLSLLITLIAFAVSPNTLIYLKWILPLLVIFIIVILTFIDLSYRLYKKASKPLPSVRQVHRPAAVAKDAIAILLLEPSDIYGHESVVSLFYLNEGYEKLIGMGYVLTIQTNGMIQVLINKLIDVSEKEIIDKALNNDVLVLKKLLVKPMISKSLV